MAIPPRCCKDYRYQFDGIGNRTLVEQSREGATPARTSSYTPNALNQYAGISHPNFMDLTGVADSLANVTINGIAALRQGRSFYKELTQGSCSRMETLAGPVFDG